MNTHELNEQLIVIGRKIKAKGWQTVSIDICISYLASFDLEPGPFDPRISYSPSIQATPHRPDGSFWGNGTSRQYVKDGWNVKSLEEAIAKLHEAANDMPMMFDEAARIDNAKKKLSEDERRLLGVR